MLLIEEYRLPLLSRRTFRTQLKKQHEGDDRLGEAAVHGWLGKLRVLGLLDYVQCGTPCRLRSVRGQVLTNLGPSCCLGARSAEVTSQEFPHVEISAGDECVYAPIEVVVIARGEERTEDARAPLAVFLPASRTMDRAASKRRPGGAVRQEVRS